MSTPANQFTAVVLSGLLTLCSAGAETITGRVVGATDGDTVKILDENQSQHTIRLAGIDAPEKRMPFGNTSKQHLASLIFEKSVEVEAEKVDRYGRRIGKIILKGQDANLAMIQAGMAWHYKQYQNEQSEEDRLTYSGAEKIARIGYVGLWREPNPTPPWQHRKEAKRWSNTPREKR